MPTAALEPDADDALRAALLDAGEAGDHAGLDALAALAADPDGLAAWAAIRDAPDPAPEG